MHKYSLFRGVCADECTREITTIGSEFKILQAFNNTRSKAATLVQTTKAEFI